jgi:hypothetical protein
VPPIKFVCATRYSEAEFFESSPLGRSLTTYAEIGAKYRVFFKDSRGLSACYNQAIDEEAHEDELLVFVHDDVYILDFFWSDKLLSGSKRFEVLGVIGNKSRWARQASFAFIDEKLTWDHPSNICGAFASGDGFPCVLNLAGQFFQPVKLLDGMLLAAKKKTFTRSGVRFDDRFKFHFYDMDICRQFEAKNISMTAIPLSVIHASPGSFGSEDWRRGYRLYLEKWGD